MENLFSFHLQKFAYLLLKTFFHSIRSSPSRCLVRPGWQANTAHYCRQLRMVPICCLSKWAVTSPWICRAMFSSPSLVFSEFLSARSMVWLNLRRLYSYFCLQHFWPLEHWARHSWWLRFVLRQEVAQTFFIWSQPISQLDFENKLIIVAEQLFSKSRNFYSCLHFFFKKNFNNFQLALQARLKFIGKEKQTLLLFQGSLDAYPSNLRRFLKISCFTLVVMLLVV